MIQHAEHPVLSYGYGHSLPPVALDKRLVPVAEALRDLLAERRLPQAEIERRAGWARRYLSRILNGHVDMKLSHVLDVLDAAQIEHKALWCRLCDVKSDPEIERRIAALEAAARRRV